MINILVIEDDPIDLISLKAKLRELGHPEPAVADHNTDMANLIKKINPQLIISDIFYENKPIGLKMIDLCDSMEVPLILVTADTRIDTFNLANKNHKVAYLVKPFHHLTLQSCIDMVMEGVNMLSEVDGDFCYVKDYNNSKVKINFKDILFIKSEGNFCHIQCQQTHYLIRTSLTHFINELNEQFVQVHKSFIINKVHVKRIASNYMLIIEQEIPIGRKFKNVIEEHFPLLH